MKCIIQSVLEIDEKINLTHADSKDVSYIRYEFEFIDNLGKTNYILVLLSRERKVSFTIINNKKVFSGSVEHCLSEIKKFYTPLG